MDKTALALLTAYLVAEFAMRPRRADGTMGIGELTIHLAVAAIMTSTMLGQWHLTAMASVVAAHLVTAAIPNSRRSLPLFAAEQAAHLCVIAALAMLGPDAFDRGWGMIALPFDPSYLLVGMSIASGLIVSLQVGGVVVGLLTQQFRDQIDPGLIAGLRNGSLYIGWLERALVLLLILIDQPGGVGFVITAKSILRFSDAKDLQHRQASEYIIIGTFISFGWGLLAAIATHWAIHHWLP